MRTFFFGCMLAASAASMMLADADSDIFAQTGTSTMGTDPWSSKNGVVTSGFERPQPHCCYFYSKQDFKGERTPQICDNGKNKLYYTAYEVMSIDCGTETFANISYDSSHADGKKFTGTAGRVQAVKAKAHKNKKTFV